MQWRLPNKQIPLDRLCYLGVINLTPDSFSDGGCFLDPQQAILQMEKLINQGVHIIDIGAESTRPGYTPVDPKEEWARLAPIIDYYRKANLDCSLSVDTRHPEVARMSLDSGVDIINDISGCSNPEMTALVANSDCGIIAVRSRIINGKICLPDYEEPTPKTSEKAVSELIEVRDRLTSAGIKLERILLDLGFGFGTTYLEDQALWDSLPNLPEALNWPFEQFCIGISRKRYVARRFGVHGNMLLDKKTAELEGLAIKMGYTVFRVHSVEREQ
ncbi:MAG: dihydropteroate synthase [Holophagaceae bacterium]|nr:dihydropteroate synthase [Holophagaceae bacterium]